LLQDLFNQLEDLQTELLQVQQQLAATQQQSQSYQQELETYADELQQTRATQAEADAARGQLMEAQQQLTLAEQQLQVARADAEALRQQLSASEVTAGAKDERIKELRAALAEVMESKEVCWHITCNITSNLVLAQSELNCMWSGCHVCGRVSRALVQGSRHMCLRNMCQLRSELFLLCQRIHRSLAQ
jgi:predicted  nucleic acid-binding Zn-ribbon protein